MGKEVAFNDRSELQATDSVTGASLTRLLSATACKPAIYPPCLCGIVPLTEPRALEERSGARACRELKRNSWQLMVLSELRFYNQLGEIS